MSPNQLIQKWQHVLDLREKARIPTWTESWSLAYCCEMASKSSHAVELGTYMGASAFVMLKANPKLHLWCVDTFAVFGTKEITENFLDKEIKDGRCEIIVGDSQRGSEMLRHMTGKIDSVWVDDGHATEDVKRDIRCFLPILRSGGTLYGHDFDVPHNDVALGVIASLPANSWSIPVPRVWSYTKP